MRSGGPSQREHVPSGAANDPYFAVVVGTGFGGAVVACRLAQACEVERAGGSARRHRPILVIERGRRYAPEDFGRIKLPDYLTQGEFETSKRLPDISRVFWENDRGLWDVRNLGELRMMQAAGYGGGSLLYANVHLRPPQKVFEKPVWKAACDEGTCACKALPTAPPPYDRSGLRPYYDRVAAMLDLARIPEKNRPPKTRAMEELADLAGPKADHFLFPPLAITFETPAGGMNRFNRPQSACTNCGNCNVGCQEGAKNTLDLNYLAVAEDLGAEVRTLTEVRTIRPFRDGGRRLLRVTYVDHLTGSPGQVVAENVFLCAGAGGSTAILMRSHDASKQEDLPFTDGQPPTVPLPVPERLGADFFTNADNLGVAFGAKLKTVGEPLSPTKGPTITAAIVHGGPNWFVLEDGGVPPTVMQGLGLMRSPLWAARNRFAAPGKGGGGILAHALETIHAAHGYWVSEAAPSATAAVSRALRQIVPASLDGIVGDLASAATLAQDEIARIVDTTMDGIDAQLKKKRLGGVLSLLRSRIVPNSDAYGPAKEATAARHPLTVDLLSSQSPMAYILAALRFLLMGAPVDDDTMMFLCQGPDRPSNLMWRDQRLRVDWKLGPDTVEIYDVQERLMRDAAARLGAELRINPDWSLGRKPLTVHAQGGCGMAGNAKEGVTTPCGRLWTSDQLYVMDGAVFPASVGVNPSSTIAAVAERNIELFIRRKMPGVEDYWNVFPDGRRETLKPREDFDDSLREQLPDPPAGVPRAQPVGLSWYEEMAGRLAVPTHPEPLDVLEGLDGGLGGGSNGGSEGASFSRETPVDLGLFRSLEGQGRLAGTSVLLKLDVTSENLECLVMDDKPSLDVKGSVLIGDLPRQQSFEIEHGQLHLHIADMPGRKRPSRTWAAPGRLTGMTYVLQGDGISVVGRKVVRDDPLLRSHSAVSVPGDVWNDLSTLYSSIRLGTGERLAGVLRVNISDFFNRQLRNTDIGPGLEDDFVRGWGFVRFARFFFGSIINAYSDWS